MKRLMAHRVLLACTEVEKRTSITTNAWRDLSWTFEEAPRLAARATREHLNGTLFDETEVEQEGPPEEADLILHDDDDDDAEDPESTETAVAEASTAVAEASEPFPTVAAEAAHGQNASCICAARTASIHQSHELFSGTNESTEDRSGVPIHVARLSPFARTRASLSWCSVLG